MLETPAGESSSCCNWKGIYGTQPLPRCPLQAPPPGRRWKLQITTIPWRTGPGGIEAETTLEKKCLEDGPHDTRNWRRKAGFLVSISTEETAMSPPPGHNGRSGTPRGANPTGSHRDQHARAPPPSVIRGYPPLECDQASRCAKRKKRKGGRVLPVKPLQVPIHPQPDCLVYILPSPLGVNEN